MKIFLPVIAILLAIVPPIVQAQTIEIVANPLPNGQGQECQGDCDNDKDCAGNLRCYQRNKGDFKSVPGCLGGEADGSRTDYCVDGDFSEVSTDLGTYCSGDGITVCYDYTYPKNYDRIAVHVAGETNPLPEPSLWVYTYTGTQEKAKGKRNYSCIEFMSGIYDSSSISGSEDDLEGWPLEPGTYEAWLLRNNKETGLASSASFTVKNCDAPLSEEPSSMPSEMPSHEPSDVPLNDESSETPSERPSEVPSEWPSQSPSSSVTCVDDPTFKYKGDKKKKCDNWVAEKPEQRCKKKYKGIKLSVYCPVACDACDSISSNIFSQGPP